jgi:hypothetical protein
MKILIYWGGRKTKMENIHTKFVTRPQEKHAVTQALEGEIINLLFSLRK